MKGKRLLAIVLSLCMLLILVPAMTIIGTADAVALPQIGTRTNFAAPASLALTNAEVKANDGGVDYVHFNSNCNFGYLTGVASADVSAIGNYDYVMSFKAMIFKDDARQAVDFTFGNIGGTPLKLMLQNSGSTKSYNPGYYGPSGEAQALGFDIEKEAGPTFAVYVQKVEGNTKVHLFLNGEYVKTFEETGAAVPAFNIKVCNEYSGYLMDMYDTQAYIASEKIYELPKMPKDAINYAIDAPYAYTGTRMSQDPYDAGNGTIDMRSGGSAVTVTFTVDDITNADEYVVSYIHVGNNWKSNGEVTKFTFANGKVSKKSNGSQYVAEGAANESTYAAVGGTASTQTFSASRGSAAMAIHVTPNADGLTRTVEVYRNGVLVAVQTDAYMSNAAGTYTVDPCFKFESNINNWSDSEGERIYGLRIYKVDPNATEFEPDATATATQTAGIKSKFNHYTVTVTENENGTVTGAGSIKEGNTAKLTATPNEGYTFIGWLDADGKTVSTANPYSFTVTGDVTLTPSYKQVVLIPELDDEDYISMWDIYPNDEEKVIWDEDNESYTFTHTYGSLFRADAEEVSVPDEEIIGTDILYGGSYVIRFKANALNYSNGWHGEVAFAKIGNMELYLQLASNGITYVGTSGSQTVSGNFQYSQDVAIYVRREAGGKTGIYIDVNGNQLFQIHEDFEVVPVLSFRGFWGEWDGWTVSELEAFPAADGEGAGEYVEPTFNTIKIIDAQYPYVITGIVGGTKNMGVHNWQTATFLVVPETEVTITVAETGNEATVGVVKNAADFGVISQGNFFSSTITEDASYAIQGYNRPTVAIVAENGSVEGVTEGYRNPQEGLQLTAVPDDGYAFDHWEFSWKKDEQDALIPYTENPCDITLAATGELTITAYFVEAVEEFYDVVINPADGGWASGELYGASYGDSTTLEAFASDGYYFRYWLINNRMYFDSVIELSVSGNVTATPVFAAIEDVATTYYVTFYTADGRFLASFSDEDVKTAVLPDVPDRYGYISGEWDFVVDDPITADMDIYPQYVKDETTVYEITVIGGKTNKTGVPFETIVTVKATNEDGFVGWKNDAGEFVSTKPVYAFFAVQDINLTAVYDGSKPEYLITALPKSGNVSTGLETFRLSIVAETGLAEGCRLIERGIVYAVGDQTTATLVIGGTGVRKKVSSSIQGGQFMYTLTDAPKDTTITARAYMVYADGQGNQKTVYSDLIDCTYEEE